MSDEPKTIKVEDLTPVPHQGIHVITTKLLAKVYGASEDNIHDNYRKAKKRFIEGKHFFRLTGDELRSFRDRCNRKYSGCIDIETKASHLTLWTERGAARHAKMLETDQAWEVFEKLEDAYFARAVSSDDQAGRSARQGPDLRAIPAMLRLIDRLKRETNPDARRTIHAALDHVCQACHAPTPPLDGIGRDAPPLPDTVAPFFAGLRRLSDLGVPWNHARDPARIAFNLKEVSRLFEAHGIPVSPGAAMKRDIQAHPAFEDIKTVNSALTGRSVKCWVFRVEPGELS